MSPFLLAFINIVTEVLPLLASLAPASIAKIIAELEAAIPAIEGTAPNVIQAIQNIVSNLSANPATTADQMTSLQALDAKLTAAWNAADSAPEA